MSGEIEKVVRDGLVAVLVSPGFGAGFSSWNDVSPFEPKVVAMVEAGRREEITRDWCEENLGLEHQYCSGADQLEIEWLPIGTPFSINEYDGSESIYRGDRLDYTA